MSEPIFSIGDTVALKPSFSINGKLVRVELLSIQPMKVTEIRSVGNAHAYFMNDVITGTESLYAEDWLMFWSGVKDAVLLAHNKLISQLLEI